jgi:hypothetical protein
MEDAGEKMNKILVMLKGIIYRVIGLELITAPKCNPVPIYIVEDDRVRVIHCGIRVKEEE